ncbi:MAG: Hsp20 family protein [Geobacter sp.]|nr:Hsp20/alpha crystallin family protein [Geobacter sp.]MSM39669.1 Hsp20 family protein [Geobacter sp.]
MASWDVFRELDSLRREMDEALRGAGMGRVLVPAFLSQGGSRRFPLLNLTEDDNAIYVEALIPGVDPTRLDMTALRNTLTLAGERKPFAGEGNNHVWHRSERGSGSFSRTIELPVEIDSDKVSATCQNGVLTVTLPKAAAAKPKKIAIQAA